MIGRFARLSAHSRRSTRGSPLQVLDPLLHPLPLVSRSLGGWSPLHLHRHRCRWLELPLLRPPRQWSGGGKRGCTCGGRRSPPSAHLHQFRTVSLGVKRLPLLIRRARRARRPSSGLHPLRRWWHRPSPLRKRTPRLSLTRRGAWRRRQWRPRGPMRPPPRRRQRRSRRRLGLSLRPRALRLFQSGARGLDRRPRLRARPPQLRSGLLRSGQALRLPCRRRAPRSGLPLRRRERRRRKAPLSGLPLCRVRRRPQV